MNGDFFLVPFYILKKNNLGPIIYMQGLIILALSFLASFLVSKFTNLKPLVNYKDKFEYVPILTSNVFADLLIIYITFTGILGVGKSWQVLTKWYKKYRLSAMVCDILIGVLYLLIARYVAYNMNYEFDIFTFSILAVLVQLVFDFLFYLIFMAVPKGHNHMLDLFKDWAKFAKADALWGDSILVIVGVILSSFLNQYVYTYIFTLFSAIHYTHERLTIYLPVEPNPPAPRSVSSREFATSTVKL